MNLDVSSLPTGVLVAVGVLILLEIVLDVVSLVDLYRRPVAQVVFGNKWIWVAIILLVNTIGAIIYLAAGRKSAVISEGVSPSAPVATRADSVADALYGARKGADDQ